MISLQEVANLNRVSPDGLLSFLRRFEFFDSHLFNEEGKWFIDDDGYTLIITLGSEGFYEAYSDLKRRGLRPPSPLNRVMEDLL